MELHLTDAKLMKSIIDPMIPVGEDLYIEISELGFRAHCQGISRAWAADAVLKRSKFSKIDVEDTVTYYVKLKDFADFMKTVQAQDELIIRENTEKSNLELILHSSAMTKKMAIRLQSSPDDFKISKFMGAKQAGAVHASSEMDSDLFLQAIKAAELGGPEVTVTATKEELMFESTDANKSAEATIKFVNNEQVKNREFKEDAESYQSIYKLEYLRHVSRIKAVDDIQVWMINNGPLILVYSFIEDIDTEEAGYLGFAVAPRVKEDDM